MPYSLPCHQGVHLWLITRHDHRNRPINGCIILVDASATTTSGNLAQQLPCGDTSTTFKVEDKTLPQNVIGNGNPIGIGHQVSHYFRETEGSIQHMPTSAVVRSLPSDLKSSGPLQMALTHASLHASLPFTP